MTAISPLKQEHLDWWENLPELWQKIFCVAIYHPDKNAVAVTDDDYEFIGDGDSDDEGYFTLAYSNPILKEPTDLLKVFQLKSIIFDREVNPKLDSVVTFIPSLRYFSQLEVISLSYNYLEDISGLAGVTTLKHLNLWECFTLEDYEPIASLTGLVSLNLSFCRMGDIGFLCPLTQLRNLQLNSDRISDISPLSGLTNLTTLEIHGNPIQDITPLFGLAQLKILEIGIEDPYNGETFDYDNLQRLKEQLPNTDIDVLWNCFTPMSDKQVMQKIAFSGIKSFRDFDYDDEKMFALMEDYAKSDDPYLKQLADLVADEYSKKMLYELHDNTINAQSDLVKSLNQLITTRDGIEQMVHILNQFANDKGFACIKDEKEYLTQFERWKWLFEQMDLEVIIRQK